MRAEYQPGLKVDWRKQPGMFTEHETPGALERLEEIALDSGLIPKDQGKRKRQLSTIALAVEPQQHEDL